MICPDSDLDCDNPGCRRGGCQGRRPNLPLFRVSGANSAGSLPLLEAAMGGATAAADRGDRDGSHRRRVAA
jgi:hypothetical protein